MIFDDFYGFSTYEFVHSLERVQVANCFRSVHFRKFRMDPIDFELASRRFEEYVRKVDTDGSGEIDLSEFFAFMRIYTQVQYDECAGPVKREGGPSCSAHLRSARSRECFRDDSMAAGGLVARSCGIQACSVHLGFSASSSVSLIQ